MVKIQNKAKLSQLGHGLGNKAELDTLGLELWLNLSLEDFPGWWGWGKAGNKAKAQLQLGLGLS